MRTCALPQTLGHARMPKGLPPCGWIISLHGRACEEVLLKAVSLRLAHPLLMDYKVLYTNSGNLHACAQCKSILWHFLHHPCTSHKLHIRLQNILLPQLESTNRSHCVLRVTHAACMRSGERQSSMLASACNQINTERDWPDMQCVLAGWTGRPSSHLQCQRCAAN